MMYSRKINHDGLFKRWWKEFEVLGLNLPRGGVVTATWCDVAGIKWAKPVVGSGSDYQKPESQSRCALTHYSRYNVSQVVSS